MKEGNTHILPAQYLRMLQGEKKPDNVECIRLHMMGEPGAVELTPYQEELKKRLDFADDLMRQRRYSFNRIAKILQQKYGYSLATARRDIADAQHLFGAERSFNKNYLIAQHIDMVYATCLLMQDLGAFKELKGMYQVLKDTILALPDDAKKDLAPSAIIFNISTADVSTLTNNAMDMTSAKANAYKKMNELNIEDAEILKDSEDDE